MRWTIFEEAQLLKLVRKHFSLLMQNDSINASSALSKQLHSEFNSPHRDSSALLYRLKKANILDYAGHVTGDAQKQRFKCILKDDFKLYDYSITFPEIKKPLNPATITALLNTFDELHSIMCVNDLIDTMANKTKLHPFQIEKTLIENNLLTVNSYRQLNYYESNLSPSLSLENHIKKQTPPAELVNKINASRALASKLYHVHEHDGAEAIFSSDGTGFGKSYGVIQGYVEYLERKVLANVQGSTLKCDFTNLIFMSPQKSQIDLDDKQKERVLNAGGEFICVLSRKDTTDLEFMDWASGFKNRDRYNQWCRSAKDSAKIGKQIRQLSYTIENIDYYEKQIEQLSFLSEFESNSEKKMLENQLKNHQSNLIKILESACKQLISSRDPEGNEIKVSDYASRAIANRKKRSLQEVDRKTKITNYEVYFEIIKQVLPFEVCRYLPSVLLMTTDKFDTSTRRIKPRQPGDDVVFESVGFDMIVGGKIKPKDPQVSTMSSKTHNAQVEYLRNEHFEINESCPFRNNNIRFTVIIDELHEAYTKLEKSCHVTLVEEGNNLAHIFSVTGRIYNAVLNLENRKRTLEDQTSFEKEMIKFVTVIRTLIEEKCELSSGTTLASMLAMFRDQLGAFEVNGASADRIISITQNVFSFNAKMYVNEEGLKRIRLRHSDGDITRTELYYEIEGDTSDTNPTLHDLFQLVSVILAACAQINSHNFKRWIKNGGQHAASSQNKPLGDFVDAANIVADEVRHIFDRTNDESLLIDHFYTYLQPKTIFSMIPVKELNYINRGAERTIILAFKMDLIKELPEAMLLRILIGSNNKTICLSATSGFTHTKNSNFNRMFLQRYAHDFGYKIVERGIEDIGMLKELRETRSNIRSVTFTEFDAEGLTLTDTYKQNPVFKAVYDDFMRALEEQSVYELKHKYKKRQLYRELEALLLAGYEGKNTLTLSLSGRFKSAFAKAYRKNQTVWQQQYGMVSKCDDKQGKRHDQFLTFTPFKGRSTIHLVFFDSPLANIENVRKETNIRDSNTVLVFMSSHKSAGTGLNYFVRYFMEKAEDLEKPCLEVDFQRLIIINSSFYSEVKDNNGNLNTLPNYVSILKHLSDDIAEHKMSEFSVNFAQGENYRLLMAEHEMSLFNSTVQSIGRVERRDTLLETEVFLPSDVVHNAAFQFSSLSESTSNEVVFESMSLLNYKFKTFCSETSIKRSFSSLEQRNLFEKNIVDNAKRIDDVHKRVLKIDWINRVRSGELEYLTICNLFRDPDSFKDPKRWLNKLQANPLYASNKHMQAIHGALFIPRFQDGKNIMLCHKRGSDGLAHKDYSALSDFSGGAREYRPEFSIFMQANKYVDFSQGGLVNELFSICNKIQKTAFKNLVPHPKLVPLLKGNLGEYLFDKVLTHYKVKPLTDSEVFDRLGSIVYEFFDRFIEVGDDLLCIDVKRWATKIDDPVRAKDVLEKSDRKIKQVNNIVNQIADKEGQAKVYEALKGNYQNIKFIYLNIAFSHNPNNLMHESSVSHSIHYLNLLQADYEYEQMYKKNAEGDNKPKEQSRLDSTIKINPMLPNLLGVITLNN